MNRHVINEKIELYGNGFDLLTTTLAEVPKEAWQFKPAPAEWSVHEIVIHLADSEAIAAQQARLMVAEPGGTVMAYDPDAWAKNLNYQSQDADEALQLLKFTRLTTYRWLQALSDSDFALSVIYPGDENPYCLDELVGIYAGHIPDHIEQIKNNITLWREQK